MIEFHEITGNKEDLELLAHFYHDIYIHQFPDPDERETLDSFRRDLDRKSSDWFGTNNYHFIIATYHGQPVAGCVSDYMCGPRAGMIEFIAVAPEMRGQGLGHRLIAHTEDLLQRDAKGALTCILAEINDPTKIMPQQDNMDPTHRLNLWNKWGYQQLPWTYLQPALSDRQNSVNYLILLAKQLCADALPDSKYLLSNIMRWVMRLEDPENCIEFQTMCRQLEQSA